MQCDYIFLHAQVTSHEGGRRASMQVTVRPTRDPSSPTQEMPGPPAASSGGISESQAGPGPLTQCILSMSLARARVLRLARGLLSLC